jgi:hypothetical protein
MTQAYNGFTQKTPLTTDAQIGSDGTVVLAPNTTHTRKDVIAALGRSGKDLSRILTWTRSSGVRSHHWVSQQLAPFIRTTGLTPTIDTHHNLYLLIPQPGGRPARTMFTAHTDTVISSSAPAERSIAFNVATRTFFTDDNNALGADDGAGVYVLLRMIEHRVPGLYVFFADEELGRRGSINYLKDNLVAIKGRYDHVVSFDRKNGRSVITSQRGSDCCSPAFAGALRDALNKTLKDASRPFFLDPTGSFTDSATFTDIVPECTNLSVGYDLQHTSSEIQQLDHLEDMIDAACAIDWAALPAKRNPNAAPPKKPLALVDKTKPAPTKKQPAPPTDWIEMLEELLQPVDPMLEEIHHFVVDNPAIVARLLRKQGVRPVDLDQFVEDYASKIYDSIEAEYNWASEAADDLFMQLNEEADMAQFKQLDDLDGFDDPGTMTFGRD